MPKYREEYHNNNDDDEEEEIQIGRRTTTKKSPLYFSNKKPNNNNKNDNSDLSDSDLSDSDLSNDSDTNHHHPKNRRQQKKIHSNNDVSYQGLDDHHHDHDQTNLLKTKTTIRRLRTVMNIGNILILTFATSVIVLYYTTSCFDGVKRQQKRKTSCPKASEDFTSFEECYGVCHNDLDDMQYDNDDCRPLHNLLNPKTTTEEEEEEQYPLHKGKSGGGTTITTVLETLCSSESLSTETGKAKCRTKCRISECCWSMDSSTTNCLDTYNDMCEVFQPCMSYYVGIGTLGMGIGPVIIADTKRNDRDP